MNIQLNEGFWDKVKGIFSKSDKKDQENLVKSIEKLPAEKQKEALEFFKQEAKKDGAKEIQQNVQNLEQEIEKRSGGDIKIKDKSAETFFARIPREKLLVLAKNGINKRLDLMDAATIKKSLLTYLQDENDKKILLPSLKWVFKHRLSGMKQEELAEFIKDNDLEDESANDLKKDMAESKFEKEYTEFLIESGEYIVDISIKQLQNLLTGKYTRSA